MQRETTGHGIILLNPQGRLVYVEIVDGRPFEGITVAGIRSLDLRTPFSLLMQSL